MNLEAAGVASRANGGKHKGVQRCGRSMRVEQVRAVRASIRRMRSVDLAVMNQRAVTCWLLGNDTIQGVSLRCVKNLGAVGATLGDHFIPLDEWEQTPTYGSN